jgi:hypothetical protein
MSQAPDPADCLNCGTQLRGQYCGHCGQRASNRLISLWELLTDAFGDLIELDSRVWRTLGPLLLKPGKLTRDYLLGRRARYMPPFRTYLVLSILFFIVAFFEPGEQFGLLLEPVAEPDVAEIAEAQDAARINAAARADQLGRAGESLSGLAKEGKLPDGMVDGIEQLNSAGLKIDLDDTEVVSCDITADDLRSLPDWLSKRITLTRAKNFCGRIQRDGGQYFLDLLLDNIPVALIVLLPLMALVLKMLYPLSRRYFVEHLLFFVHFHAFVFLILILQIIFARTAGLLAVPDAIAVLGGVAASCYIPVYLFLAMRRVYSQHRLVTALKFVALLVTYVFGASLTLLGATVFAVLSV